jgi:SsrA-binding protein
MILAENRRARFDYEVVDAIEAGLELKGFEVKAAKAGKANLAGSFAVPQEGGLWLVNAEIAPYQAGNTPEGYDPRRSRRLLVRQEEIADFVARKKSEGLTLVPLKMYNKNSLVKVEIALVRPKKKADKREMMRKREVTREIKRTLKS